MRLKLISKDTTLIKTLGLMLSRTDHTLDTIDPAAQTLDLAGLYDYDILLLDPTVPEFDGETVLRQCDLARIDTPVLVLGTQGNPAVERTLAARLATDGVDDFLAKPFHREDLLARVEAIVTRAKGAQTTRFQIGKLDIDTDARLVQVRGVPVHLTGKEFDILSFLVARKGQTLTKDMFLDHLYGGLNEPEMKIIDVFVCKLRKKLSQATGGETYIETVWGRGYVLRDPAEGLADAPLRSGSVR